MQNDVKPENDATYEKQQNHIELNGLSKGNKIRFHRNSKYWHVKLNNIVHMIK